METRWLGRLAIGLLLVGVLAGCASTIASRGDLGGLPRADSPEYMTHPLRLIALPAHFTGNVLQYTVVEPLYFLLSPVPEAVGLSLEERRDLAERRQAGLHPFGGRPQTP